MFQTCLWQTHITFFEHLLVVTRKKLARLARARIFWKKYFCHFLTHIEISNVCFSLFFCNSKTCFSNLFWQTWRTFFCASFSYNRKKYILWCKHVFLKQIIILPIFHPIRHFKRFFFNFSRASKTCFWNLIFTKWKTSILRISRS